MANISPAEQEKFMKFNKLADRCCLAKIPSTFVALGSSTSMSEKLNDLIKSAIPRETSFSKVFLKLLTLFETRNLSPPEVNHEKFALE